MFRLSFCVRLNDEGAVQLEQQLRNDGDEAVDEFEMSSDKDTAFVLDSGINKNTSAYPKASIREEKSPQAEVSNPDVSKIALPFDVERPFRGRGEY